MNDFKNSGQWLSLGQRKGNATRQGDPVDFSIMFGMECFVSQSGRNIHIFFSLNYFKYTHTHTHAHTYIPHVHLQENKQQSRRSYENCLKWPALLVKPGQLFSRPPGTKPVGRGIVHGRRWILNVVLASTVLF